MSKLSKIETFFNNVTFTADDQLFVGVDVHKKSYHVALYLNDATSIDFVMPAKKEQLSQKLMPTMPALRQVVYETGPSGYGLARHLQQDRLPVSVAATSKIPRTSVAGDKTDRLERRQEPFKPCPGSYAKAGSRSSALSYAASPVAQSGKGQGSDQILPVDARHRRTGRPE
jgi:hypothetical protein